MMEEKKRAGCFRIGCITVFLGAAAIAGLVYFMFSPARNIPDRFVLSLHIGGPVDEISGESAGILPFKASQGPLSLQELMVILDNAGSDSHVRSVLLDIDGLTASPAKIGQLRRSIEQLRKSGKKVVAFLRTAEDKDYLLATACDSVIAQRGSWLLLDGLKAELFFYKEPLKKLGIGFQAAQWKEYKSGIEPFTRSSASSEYLEQVNRLLDDSWDDYVSYVSRRRAISREAFTGVIDSLAMVSSEKALELKLIDGVSSMWSLEKSYRRKLGKPDERIFVGGREYLQTIRAPFGGNTRERIAVITVAGTIVQSAGYSSMGRGDGIDERTLKTSIDDALADRDVKAIVLRIDSPGGDALAARNMLEMLDSAKVKKPLVASMSGLAASGGYMVALAGDRILAEPMTLTGSIGVYALKPDISVLQEKTGLNRQVVTRGRLADANTEFKPFDQEAYSKFVAASGEVYRDFTAKVAARRKLTPEQVDAVAGGRVWTGKRAVEVGLVDKIGGLQEAIKTAQQLAKMDSTKVPSLSFYPGQKTWTDYLFDGELTSAVHQLVYQLAGTFFSDLLPFQANMPDRALIRMLLQTDQPSILALYPCDIVIR